LCRKRLRRRGSAGFVGGCLSRGRGCGGCSICVAFDRFQRHGSRGIHRAGIVSLSGERNRSYGSKLGDPGNLEQPGFFGRGRRNTLRMQGHNILRIGIRFLARTRRGTGPILRADVSLRQLCSQQWRENRTHGLLQPAASLENRRFSVNSPMHAGRRKGGFVGMIGLAGSDLREIARGDCSRKEQEEALLAVSATPWRALSRGPLRAAAHERLGSRSGPHRRMPLSPCTRRSARRGDWRDRADRPACAAYCPRSRAPA